MQYGNATPGACKQEWAENFNNGGTWQEGSVMEDRKAKHGTAGVGSSYLLSPPCVLHGDVTADNVFVEDVDWQRVPKQR